LNIDLIVAASIFLVFVSVTFFYILGYQKQTPQWQALVELRKKAMELTNEILTEGKPENWEKENVLPGKIGLTSSAFLIPIIVSDESGYERINEPVSIEVEFDVNCKNLAWKESVRIFDENFNEIPFKFVNQTFCSSGFLQKAILFFELNVSANSTRKIQVFFHNLTKIKSKEYSNFSNLVLWLKFDEGYGNLAYDFSGNENNGILYDANNSNNDGNTIPQWVDGKFGKALSFDGVDDYVEISHTRNLEPEDITIIMWIYPTQWNHNPIATALLTKRVSTEDGYFIFWYNTTNTLNWDWGGNAYRWNTGYLPSLDNWSCLSFVRNSSGRMFFVNGELIAFTSNSGNNVTTGSVLRIGMDTFQDQYWYKGIIDEIKIYNRALTEEEILSHYQQPLSIKIFPKTQISLISFEKVEALRNISYELLKDVLKEGYDFRIEIYEK